MKVVAEFGQFVYPNSEEYNNHPSLFIFNALLDDLNPIMSHVGIGYKVSGSTKINFLHLLGPRKISKDAPKFHWGWSTINIPEPRRRYLANECDKFLAKHVSNEEVLFHPKYEPSGGIDGNTGDIILGPGCIGLTCCTYVLKWLEYEKVLLVDHVTWSVRDEDDKWKNRAYNMIARRSADDPKREKDAEIFAQGWPVPFIRPTEIVSSAIYGKYPVSFDNAHLIDSEIIQTWKIFLDSCKITWSHPDSMRSIGKGITQYHYKIVIKTEGGDTFFEAQLFKGRADRAMKKNKFPTKQEAMDFCQRIESGLIELYE